MCWQRRRLLRASRFRPRSPPKRIARNRPRNSCPWRRSSRSVNATQKERPGDSGALCLQSNVLDLSARSGGLGVDDVPVAIADRDLAWLLGLGNLADEVDVQEPVLERSTLHHDVLSKLEHTLEGAGGDALV